MNSKTQRSPKVSIGLPVYNGTKYLSRSIDSLLGQTFGDFELIIADNASTDGTEDICRQYAALDHRIRYHRNRENIGIANNFNHAFKLACGEYFKWHCSDDRCEPTLLERCIQILETQPSAVLAYAKTRFIDENDVELNIHDPGWHLPSPDPAERMRYVIDATHWINSFYGLLRSASLRKTRLFPVYPHGDHALLGELCLLGTFHEIPDSLFQRRVHEDNSTKHHLNPAFYKAQQNRLQYWKKYRDYMRIIATSNLSSEKKLELMLFTLKRMYWNKKPLLLELRALV